MDTFGKQLRYYRRQSRDPDRGGLLTQARLGELIGLELGGAGYAGAAVSYWEQDETKINEDDRLVLVSLIKVLYIGGGLTTQSEANDLLRAGNYRGLDEDEAKIAFPGADSPTDHSGEPSQEPTPGTHQTTKDSAQPDGQPTPHQKSEQRAPAADRELRRKQLILLNKVNHFWVEGVLERSISEVTLIDLKMRSQPDAVEQPWVGIVDPTVFADRSLTDVPSIDTVFENSDRALLILGTPGAGKTTVLLLLAKELIARAREDSSQPIPVVLNLASWEAARGPLDDWIVDELTAKYQIPRQIGHRWLDDDQLVLLLDGFDEVRAKWGPACAEEINHFRETRGLTGIAICSRIERYEASSAKLSLGGAVVIDPLTTSQVDNYLEAAGPRLSALRDSVQKDGSMRDMARSPLMLSIMGVTYSDLSQIRAVDEDVSEANPQGRGRTPYEVDLDSSRRQRLFRAYVQRMFDRYGGDPAYPQDRTEKYLSWLARMLTQHNKSVFLIEQMQPSWLPSNRLRRLYILTHGLIVGLVSGIILSLFIDLVELPNSEFTDSLSSYGRSGFIAVVIAGNLLLGLVASAISGFYMERYDIRRLEGTDKNRLKWQRAVVTGLVISSLTAIFFLLQGEMQLALAWGAAEATVYVVVARYIHGQSYDRDIRVVESINWSWRHALGGLLVGVALGGMALWIGKRLGGEISLKIPSVFALGAFLLMGMRGRRLEEKSRPNEGIILSLRNGFIAAVPLGIVLGAQVWIFYDSWIAGLTTAVIMVLIVFSLFGGSTVTKHLLVRGILRREDSNPWRYARFLDHTSRLVFLRKVGGGYIFLHRYLQDYFAKLPAAHPEQPHREESPASWFAQDTQPDVSP